MRVPAHRIESIVITENFVHCQVRFFLSALLKGLQPQESNPVLFHYSHPRLNDLLPVYKHLKLHYDSIRDNKAD